MALICLYLYGETHIIDQEEIFGNWIVADSPYIIEGEAIIPQGETLIIEAGVHIKLATGTIFDYSNNGFNAGFIRINGKITAIGMEEEPISFMRDGSVGNWGSLIFSETADNSGKLQNCLISYGNEITNINGSNYYGMIAFNNSGITLEQNTIEHSESNTIFCTNNAHPDIIGNTISYSNSIAILCDSSFPEITGNTILDNNYGIYCYNNSILNIYGNTLENNSHEGIFCQDSDLYIINNIISGSSTGIDCYNSDAKIIGNVINGNGSGIYCYDNSSPDITNNTIVKNTEYGIFCYNICNPDIVNCILWDNSDGSDIVISGYDENTSHPRLAYSLLESPETSLQPEVQVLTGNIFAQNPLFVNYANDDFQLIETSPCVNSGNPNTVGLDLPDYDLAGNPRVTNNRVDMGAYEWMAANSENNSINAINFIKIRNYPNPFNPQTTIFFEMPNKTTGNLEIVIYNTKGQKVKRLKISEVNPAYLFARL